MQTESIDQPDPNDSPIEAADFETLLRVSMEELMVLTQNHQENWHFGKEEEWQLNQERGELVLTFPGRQIVAPAQIIGAYDTQNAAWQWAWAKQSLPHHLIAHSLLVRDYGEQQGVERLTSPEWQGEETDCWYMAALACRLCNSQGAYRAPGENSFTFMTFGEVEAFPPFDDPDALAKNFLEQTAQEFRNISEDPEQQQLACCRYFRRGPLAGLSQSELIDFLGLSSPSVLDLAGYPPEAAQQVMEIAGRLSEEEIHKS
jgi:hypothetical protein